MNGTKPSSTQWLAAVPITLEGKRDHFRHRQETRVFFWLHPFPMCSSKMVCLNKYLSLLLETLEPLSYMEIGFVFVCYRSQRAASTCACGLVHTSAAFGESGSVSRRFFTKSLQRVNCATVPDDISRESKVKNPLRSRLASFFLADILGDEQSFPE